MKKFTLKWKLFLIGNYLELVILGIALFFMIVGLSNGIYAEKDGYIPALLITSFAIVCLNSFFNIFALHRYFPDTPIPQTLRSLMIGSGILTCLDMVFLFLVGIGMMMAYEEEQEARLILTIFIIGYFLLWTIGVFLLIFQFQLFSFLQKKEKNKIESLIDSLGNTDELYP
jgi:hypothetical protein